MHDYYLKGSNGKPVGFSWLGKPILQHAMLPIISGNCECRVVEVARGDKATTIEKE
jgi:hypothetical protein